MELGNHHLLLPPFRSSKFLPSLSRSILASNSCCASDFASCFSSSPSEKLKLLPSDDESVDRGALLLPVLAERDDADESAGPLFDIASCLKRSHALPDCLFGDCVCRADGLVDPCVWEVGCAELVFEIADRVVLSCHGCASCGDCQSSDIKPSDCNLVSSANAPPVGDMSSALLVALPCRLLASCISACFRILHISKLSPLWFARSVSSIDCLCCTLASVFCCRPCFVRRASASRSSFSRGSLARAEIVVDVAYRPENVGPIKIPPTKAYALPRATCQARCALRPLRVPKRSGLSFPPSLNGDQNGKRNVLHVRTNCSIPAASPRGSP